MSQRLSRIAVATLLMLGGLTAGYAQWTSSMLSLQTAQPFSLVAGPPARTRHALPRYPEIGQSPTILEARRYISPTLTLNTHL